MSQWAERISNHPIHERLKAVQRSFEQVEPQVEKDPQAIQALERIKSAVSMLRGTLASADPEVVPPAVLGQCHDQLQNILSQVDAYLPNGRNITYLNNANNYVDNLLAEIPRIPALRTVGEVEKVGEAVSSLRKSIGKYHGSVKSDLEKAQAEVAALRASSSQASQEYTAAKGKAEAAVADILTRFTAGEAQRATEATKAEQVRNEQFNSASQKLVAEFAEAERSREAAAKASRDQSERAAKDTIEQLKLDAEATRADLGRRGDTVLAELAKRLEQAEEVMHVIGSTGMTAEYQKSANRARVEAWIWQGVALASLIGLIVVALVYILPALSQSLSWEAYTARLFVASGFAAIATYAGGQARRLHRREAQHRDMQLRLSSIGPYIAPLKTERKHVILESLVGPLFISRPAAGPQLEPQHEGGRPTERLFPEILNDTK